MKKNSPDSQTPQAHGHTKAQAQGNEANAANQADGPTLHIGIDWADENHAYHCVTPDGKVLAEGTYSPEGTSSSEGAGLAGGAC